MITLNYKSMGIGRPIIIIHGLLGMLDNWQTFGRILSENYQVFLVDMRNHGRSPHLSGMTYREMAQDLLEFMDQQWLHDDVSIIGHSMGGKVAMQLANDDSDRISNMFVIDIAPKSYPSTHEGIFSSLASVDLSMIKSRKEVAAELSNRLNDTRVVGFLMKNLSRRDEGYQWKMNLQAIQNGYSDIIGGPDLSLQDPYNGRSYFYRGANSTYITDEDFPLIKKYFLRAELVTVPNAGHWVHADNLNFLLSSVRNKMDFESSN